MSSLSPAEAGPVRLRELIESHSILKAVIARWDAIRLPDSWLSGSAVAQARWNEVFGFPPAYGMADIDLVYFDGADLSAEAEQRQAVRVARLLGDLPVAVDIKNQARVHLWYEARFGRAIRPYRSAGQAIATFPTTSAAIGLRPGPRDLSILAPYGLADLLQPVVRANPVQITREFYEAKTRRWRALWPELAIEPWPAEPPTATA